MLEELNSELITVKDWIRWGSSRFVRAKLSYGHGTDNAWDECAVLVLWALAQPWERLDLIYDTRLTVDEKKRVFHAIGRRIKEKVPAAYITGEANFGGLRFEVNENVLVPRSPIAELLLNGMHPWFQDDPASVLDLCTGSGCIGILAASVFQETNVDISDISASALAVAERNIRNHAVADRVTAIESDLFNAPHFIGRKYDLILSNPPYVDAHDLSSMPAEYHAEPVLGLAAGNDGLALARRILRDAGKHLTRNGLLVVEVGNSWVALEEAYPEVPFVWLEFEHGGHGVFMLSAEQLHEFAEFFNNK
ncbi:50S ribosomal protein L3 N(5)-glutamine methyltransferase [Teredinibacter turnerae]|uniref:50S ribosomal protein L3 N(5)-glutamine methyltransferase n=1 Tax=Teredinibacter turnerae TaxID=2426 RepID=UPI00035D4803|nr:50S ribosomal protein L3 N(5)-glutamine methyltransferase [Teredinibacter turnerae]